MNHAWFRALLIALCLGLCAGCGGNTETAASNATTDFTVGETLAYTAQFDRMFDLGDARSSVTHQSRIVLRVVEASSSGATIEATVAEFTITSPSLTLGKEDHEPLENPSDIQNRFVGTRFLIEYGVNGQFQSISLVPEQTAEWEIRAGVLNDPSISLILTGAFAPSDPAAEWIRPGDHWPPGVLPPFVREREVIRVSGPALQYRVLSMTDERGEQTDTPDRTSMAVYSDSPRRLARVRESSLDLIWSAGGYQRAEQRRVEVSRLTE